MTPRNAPPGSPSAAADADFLQGGGALGALIRAKDSRGARRWRRCARAGNGFAPWWGVPQLVWHTTKEGDWTWASPQWTSCTGQPEPESHGRGWLGAVQPEDRDACLAAWREAGVQGVFRAEHRLRHASEGRFRRVQSQALPVRDEAGRIVEWLGTTTDVEDLRRRHEERILIAELRHRTRNLLTVVRGVADQTLAASGSLDEFGAQFDQRLAALGRVQGLLSREVAPNVTVDELLRLELAAHGVDAHDTQRVRLGGPRVALPARAVQMLALAALAAGLGRDRRRLGRGGCGHACAPPRLRARPDRVHPALRARRRDAARVHGGRRALRDRAAAARRRQQAGGRRGCVVTPRDSTAHAEAGAVSSAGAVGTSVPRQFRRAWVTRPRATRHAWTPTRCSRHDRLASVARERRYSAMRTASASQARFTGSS
ncbi:MAG: PAS domain-containing protein [Acetobacteraceae bacterium]|nr:PAS domain-containing protein [Acetobacteraceae bacterium]